VVEVVTVVVNGGLEVVMVILEEDIDI